MLHHKRFSFLLIATIHFHTLAVKMIRKKEFFTRSRKRKGKKEEWNFKYFTHTKIICSEFFFWDEFDEFELMNDKRCERMTSDLWITYVCRVEWFDYLHFDVKIFFYMYMLQLIYYLFECGKAAGKYRLLSVTWNQNFEMMCRPKCPKHFFWVCGTVCIVERINARNDTNRFVSFYLDKFKLAPVHGCVCRPLSVCVCQKWVMHNCFLLSLLFHIRSFTYL